MATLFDIRQRLRSVRFRTKVGANSRHRFASCRRVLGVLSNALYWLAPSLIVLAGTGAWFSWRPTDNTRHIERAVGQTQYHNQRLREQSER